MPKFNDLSFDVISYIFNSYMFVPYLCKDINEIFKNSKVYKNIQLFNEFLKHSQKGNHMSIIIDETRDSIDIIRYISDIKYTKEYLYCYIDPYYGFGCDIGIDIRKGELVYKDIFSNWKSLIKLEISKVDINKTILFSYNL